jgi:hypothetical protein
MPSPGGAHTSYFRTATHWGTYVASFRQNCANHVHVEPSTRYLLECLHVCALGYMMCFPITARLQRQMRTTRVELATSWVLYSHAPSRCSVGRCALNSSTRYWPAPRPVQLFAEACVLASLGSPRGAEAWAILALSSTQQNCTSSTRKPTLRMCSNGSSQVRPK